MTKAQAFSRSPVTFKAQVDEPMQIPAPLASILLTFALLLQTPQASTTGKPSRATQGEMATRQLYAVRGELTARKPLNKGWLQLTIKPKDATEVAVTAHENDPVGNAVSRTGGADLVGLLSGTERDNETITAAELEEGDVVSVIYDPQQQNRALEIYVH